MIAEQRAVQPQDYASTKYYQFATIIEHVIDCFHTIVSDETNPYHPPLGWLTRKAPIKSPEDDLFDDLIAECEAKYVQPPNYDSTTTTISPTASGNDNNINNNIDTNDSQGSLVNISNINTSDNHNSNNYISGNHDSNTSGPSYTNVRAIELGGHELSLSVRTRLEKCTPYKRKEIVSRKKDGSAPLFIASKNGHANVAKSLLDICGAEIEQHGSYETLDHHIHSVSPLWVAAVSGRLNVVELLCDRGANIDALSDTGSTPLRSVCYLCKDEPISNLETIGDARDNENVDDDIYMRIVKFLISRGADISRPNYNGGTCLINSIHNNNLAEFLIDGGADVNASDYQSQTALHYAIHQGRSEICKMLIAHGADPFLRTISNDDALQLSCIGGNIEMFNHLIQIFYYPPQRLADAYKLLGSSVLELHYDLVKVRNLWTTSLKFTEKLNYSVTSRQFELASGEQNIDIGIATSLYGIYDQKPQSCAKNAGVDRDKRRSKAFGDIVEFSCESQLQAMSADEFRIQSLIISERALGKNHRETIQRLLYRGTFYMNSLQPERCINLWIYALILRLEHDSIFHFESIFAAQTIAKLFLDFFQQQPELIKFDDVYDVLSLLIGQLKYCKQKLQWKPTACLHEDISDLLLNITVNLFLVLNHVGKSDQAKQEIKQLTRRLIAIDPRMANGSSLLHICVAPSMFESDLYRSLESRSTLAPGLLRGHIPDLRHQFIRNDNSITEPNPPRIFMAPATGYARLQAPQLATGALQNDRQSPILEMIESLIEYGMDIDSVNQEGLSALQKLCLSNTRTADKRRIIKRLVERGAHVDGRTSTPEQNETISSVLRESGIDPVRHITLSCLAARQIARLKVDVSNLSENMRKLVALH